jgi:hypothetical protein
MGIHFFFNARLRTDKVERRTGGGLLLSKDQIIGATLFLVCLLIGVLYVVTLFYPEWLSLLGIQAPQANTQFWTIAIPVLVAFIAIIGIGAWIGWTMATTPPPKPIVETRSINETEEKESKETAQT